jgi:hypothetical protein
VKTPKVLVWALKSKHGLLFAQGCYVAPWIFSTREQARKAARDAREAKIECRPVKIKLTVIIEETTAGGAE